MDEDVERLFQGWHGLVVCQCVLGPANGCDVSSALEVVARHMYLVLRQGVDDVGHALARILGVARLGKACAQLAEGFK